MTSDFDALIIGAGVAGCTAAIRLAHAGWSVALIEKQRFPRRKVCGECIAASNLPLLDALGIATAFDRLAGAGLRRVGLYVRDELLAAPLPRGPHPVHPWGRALGREHLDTLLLQRAAELGVSVWQPWAARSLAREGTRHACLVQAQESGETRLLHGRVLIDAHGSWEPDPDTGARQRRPPRGGDLFAFKGNFRNPDLDADLLPVLAFPGGYGGMVVADGGVLTIACCIRRDTLQALRARTPGVKAAVAVQAHLQATCRGVRQVLRRAEPQDAWLAVGPIRPGIRTRTPSATRFAVGNAAGEAHPILGEGISMAIQSAWLLCDHLIAHDAQAGAGAADPDIGRAYASAWKRNFARRIRLAAVLARLAMRPAALVRLLPLLRSWPGILTAGARLGGKINCAVEVASMQAPAASSRGMAQDVGNREPK
jgi:flavin-dependent dehydrogenase